MDLRKLKTLIDLVSESNVSELEITSAEGKVRIVKAGAAPAQVQPMLAAPALTPPLAPVAVVPVVVEPAVNHHAVKSPMVGTFYRSALQIFFATPVLRYLSWAIWANNSALFSSIILLLRVF